MMNRTTLAGLLLALAAPSFGAPANAPALGEARSLAAGRTDPRAAYDGGADAGSVRIDRAATDALTTGGLTVIEPSARPPALIPEVPAPALQADEAGAISKKGGGFFSRKALMAGLSSAGAGVVIGFLLGGLPGALIGALIGGLAGFILSKLL